MLTVKETIKAKRSARLLKMGTVKYISGLNPAGRGGVGGGAALVGGSLWTNMIGSSSGNANSLILIFRACWIDGFILSC